MLHKIDYNLFLNSQIMIMKTLYSPNFSKKIRKIKDIKLIILHYTGMQSKIASIKRLIDPKFKVSCHYLIDRKGLVIKLVDENKIAWHAGKSKWKHFVNLNKNSIGICLVGGKTTDGQPDCNYTFKQYTALVNLVKKLKQDYSGVEIVGHRDVADSVSPHFDVSELLR